MSFDHDPDRCGICLGAAEQKKRRERPKMTVSKIPVFLADLFARPDWGRP